MNCLGKFISASATVVFLFSGLSYSQNSRTHKYYFQKPASEEYTSDRNSILVNYSLSELEVESITLPEGEFYRIRIPGHLPSSQAGKPDLPVLSKLLTVPGEGSYNIRISEVKSTRIYPSKRGFRGLLYPAQEGETKQEQKQRPEFSIDRKIYSSPSLISSDTVTLKTVGKVRNTLLANLIISPIRYNPKSNYIEVITSMKIEISFGSGWPASTKSTSGESYLFEQMLSKGTLNYYPSDIITGYSDRPVEMILVTDTAFRKHLQPFLKWKSKKGFIVHVLYKGKGLAGTTYQEIKESITNVYNASLSDGHAPEYLLIVGDINKIPYYGTGYVTDMYYGEFNGNGDYIPDMFIGRIPASDTTQVKSVVQKIIDYEKFAYADTNKFYLSTLVVTGKDETYADYMNGQVKYAITNYLNTSNRIDNSYYFYYPEGYTKKDSVLKLIKKGLSFINYSGHGSGAGWLHLDILTKDIAGFNNLNKYPFVISNACRTAQYNDTASFGNKMVVSPGKGSIGFIGCSNDSYWDEDFYWSVGTGIPGPNPTYAKTGLGAYDRLFHTHGESPSEWYYTMGQVNFAGNLSVSASPSGRKKYYWETYTLLGDPSVIPIIGRPLPFNLSLPDTIPNGIRSLSITIEPHSYAAISSDDILWDASFASPSGSVVLDLPDVSNRTCDLVITGQNRIPLIKKIIIGDILKEFINLSGTEINDIEGNNNKVADFGEKIFLKLKISNLGQTDAINLSATATSTSEWITINKGNIFIGNLPARSEITIDDQIELTVNKEIPDLSIATIELVLKDNKTEKKYKIDITLHAPKLEISNCIIDDSVFGNGDYVADPGETFTLLFQVKNIGTSNISGQFEVSTRNENLAVLDPTVKSGILQFGETTSIPVTVKLSESAMSGDYILVLSSLDCNPYFVNRNFTFRVGKVRESFESSNFRVFPWINDNKVPWIINSQNSYDGNLSARSGAISHNSTTVLMMRAVYSSTDTLKFYYRVSSETNYDYFAFKLNDNEVFRASGEIPWEKRAVPVPAGLNKMEWIYKKDNSVSQGADAAWIDLVDFTTRNPVRYVQRDLTVARIVSPVQKEVYGLEPVTVRLLNVGADTISGFNLAYSINEYPPVKQYFDIKINPFSDSVTVTFERRANLNMSGKYDIMVYGYENRDDYLNNDTLAVSVENLVVDESMLAFPNPFSENLHIVINSDNERKARISLTDMSGKKVIDIQEMLNEGSNDLVINTLHLNSGLYLLNVISGSINRVVQVVKIKQ